MVSIFCYYKANIYFCKVLFVLGVHLEHKTPERELLDVFLVWQKVPNCLHWEKRIINPISSAWEYLFTHSFVIESVIKISYLYLIYYRSIYSRFSLHFPFEWDWTYFICLREICITFFCELSILIHCPIFLKQ